MIYTIFDHINNTHIFYYSHMHLCGFDGKLYIPLHTWTGMNKLLPFIINEATIEWKLAPNVVPHRKWAAVIVPRDEDRFGHIYLVLGVSDDNIKHDDAKLRHIQRWVRRKMTPYVLRSRRCKALALTFLARSTVLNHDCVSRISAFLNSSPLRWLL